MEYMNGELCIANICKIRTILLEKDLTIKELAERIETNENNLSSKLLCNNFLVKELGRYCGDIRLMVL